MRSSCFRINCVRRDGITLVEVIGTLSVLLVLAVSAAGILGAVTEIGLRTSDAKLGRASIQRLAEVFRRDVHLSGEIDLVGDAWPIELASDSTTIRYEWDAETNIIRRSEWEDSQRLSMDRFPMPPNCEPRVSTTNQLVTVVLRETAMTKPWIIEARRP